MSEIMNKNIKNIQTAVRIRSQMLRIIEVYLFLTFRGKKVEEFSE